MRKENIFGPKISYYRKLNGLTQSDLAKLIGVSCQAISKWEQQVCCPDILCLPKLAAIFGISIDELFGVSREREAVYEQIEGLPWEDDGKLRIVICNGRKLLDQSTHICSDGENVISVHFHGDGYDVDGVCKLSCGK